MKTILVLTDFSLRAEYAAEYAVHIAAKNRCNLLLCHALEVNTHLSNTIEYTWPIADHIQLRKDSLMDLEAKAKRLAKLVPADSNFKPSIRYMNDFGLISEVVEKVIAEKAIDLVVMGSHRSNGLARFLFGSHTHDVLDEISCPVLLVPEGLKFENIQNVAYATDLTFNDTKVIDFLTRLAQPFQAQISINHVSPTDYPMVEAIHPIPRTGVRYEKLVYKNLQGNNIEKSLWEMSNTDRIDILALVHKRYDFFEGLFHASISKRMADMARIPLIVFPYSYSKNPVELSDDELDDYCFHPEDGR